MGVDIGQYRAAIGSFIQKGYFSHKNVRKQENFKSGKNKNWFKFIKVILVMCISFLAVAEPNNNLNKYSEPISVAERHSLSAVNFSTGKINGGVSLNRNIAFVFTVSSNRVQYYRFANLDNKYSKYTNGNRKHSGIKNLSF